MVAELRNHVIVAQALSGSAKGKVVRIRGIDLSPSETVLTLFLRYRRIPIKSAFAI